MQKNWINIMIKKNQNNASRSDLEYTCKMTLNTDIFKITHNFI